MMDIAPDGLSRWVILLQAGGSAAPAAGSPWAIPLSLQVALLAVSFLGVIFFTSAESALIAVNKIRIRFLVEQGSAAAQAVDRVLAQHEKFFATILLSQNAFTIFATALGTALAAELLGGAAYAALLTTVIMTVVVSIFGEITPKTLAATYSERWSLIAARPVAWAMWLCTPFIYFFTAVPRLIYRALGTPASEGPAPGLTEGELRMMIDLSQQQGAVESGEAQRLHRVFHFHDRRLSEIMTPRTEIVWIAKGTTLRQFLTLYAENSHTRFPVYEGNQETVLGVLSNKEMLIAQGREQISMDDPVTDNMRPVDFIPETVTISDAFDAMQEQRLSMMLVTNEYGGIAGLVTLKQLTAVIVGTMVDDDPPSAQERSSLTRLPDGAYLLDGGMSIIEINDRLSDDGIALPQGDYQTIAGLVLNALGELPQESTAVPTDGMTITVTEMAGARINRVRLERTAAAASSSDPAAPAPEAKGA